MGRQYFVTFTYMSRYQKSQCWCTPIFGISRLNIAATNNILLISAGKHTNIGIDHRYQLIPIMDLRCYNRSFSSSAVDGMFRQCQQPSPPGHQLPSHHHPPQMGWHQCRHRGRP
jgi:hypothetical protein